MKVLAIQRGHDSSLTLMSDGHVEMVVESERVVGIKHAPGPGPIPAAAEELFRQTGVAPDAVDAVALVGSNRDMLEAALSYEPSRVAELHSGSWATSVGTVKVPSLPQLTSLGIAGLADDTPVYYVCHHAAHAANAIYASGWEDCAVLVSDGYGVCCGTMAYTYDGVQLNPLRHWRDRFLAGWKYGVLGKLIDEISACTINDLAGKVMGLSSYGSSRADWCDFLIRYFCDTSDYMEIPKTKRLFAELFPPDGLGENECSAADGDTHDLLAALQRAFEDVVCHAVNAILSETGMSRLAMSGGCCLNVLNNRRVADLESVGELFIPPNCSDTGLSMGGAVILDARLSERLLHHPAVSLRHRRSPYLGAMVTDRPPIELDRHDGDYEGCWFTQEASVDDLAGLLCRGRIIGIVTGRSEIGPRALCHRSILSLPRPAGVKDVINQKIKHREWWRPFAPVCRWQDAQEYFDLPECSPYMLIGAQVHTTRRTDLAGITHVDGTARPQTIPERQAYPFMWDVLAAVKDRTGTGVLLNTSFNKRGRPMVNSFAEAYHTFVSTGLDALWYEGLLICKLDEQFIEWHTQRALGLLRGRLRTPDLVVFGAGQHTQWLERIVPEMSAYGLRIRAVLDDDPSDREFWGQPVVKADTSEVVGTATTAVLLSTDCHQSLFAGRCRELWGNEMQLVNLHADLPPGPYEKGP